LHTGVYLHLSQVALTTAVMSSKVSLFQSLLGLHAVLHAAVRLITGIHINRIAVTIPVRSTLHWLPVPQRIIYEIALIAFHFVPGHGPEFLSQLTPLQLGV